MQTHDLAGTVRRLVSGPVRGSLWLAAVFVAAVLAVLILRPGNGAQRPGTLVVASLPYWALDTDTTTVLANRGDVTEVSPWMYGLDPDGRIVPQYPPNQAAAVTADVDRLRAAGLPVVPTLSNVTDGEFAYPPVARVLHDPNLLADQVTAIAALVRDNDYAGIDLDYEDLRGDDRAAFNDLVTRLGAALHAEGRTLSVAVFAKTTDAGYDERNVAQDYAAIGRAADQVRLMGYDYHWATSPAGPVAPIGWVQDVLTYAISQIPAGKIVLGVPCYGYDWSGTGPAASVTWQQAVRLAQTRGASVRFDAASQSPTFDYVDDSGRDHTVWFENAASSAAKFQAAHDAGVRGVYLWLYGDEDPGTWSALRRVLPVSWPPAGAIQGVKR